MTDDPEKIADGLTEATLSDRIGLAGICAGAFGLICMIDALVTAIVEGRV